MTKCLFLNFGSTQYVVQFLQLYHLTDHNIFTHMHRSFIAFSLGLCVQGKANALHAHQTRLDSGPPNIQTI